MAAVDGVDQSDGRRWSRIPDHMTYEEWRAGRPQASNPANRTMAEFFEMPGTRRKLDAAGVSKTEARRLLTRQLEDLNVSSGSFRKLPAGDQQRALDMALARRKPTHGEMRRAGVKPINEALYSSQKNYVERHGGCVVRGGKDVTRMLDQRGADAIFYAGDRTILLREQPTTSEVLEEVYHFRQDLRGDYADLPQDEMVTRREIDAQNYLLGVTERYRIPDSEVEQTKRNLAGYEADLRKMEARRHEGD